MHFLHDSCDSHSNKRCACMLLELDRLTTVVRAIENDCQICPVGSYKMTPEH